MKKIFLFTLFILISNSILFSQSDNKIPSFEDVLSLKSASTPIISPDGNHILFTVSQTEWEKNRYDTEIWIIKNGEEAFQLTNNPDGNSSSPAWSPNGEWISFTSSRGEKNQLYVMRSIGGEAFRVTNIEQGIGSYSWSPDSKKIAFTIKSQHKKADKAKEEKYGKFAIEDEVQSLSRLWCVKFNPESLSYISKPGDDECLRYPNPEKLIDSVDFTVTGFSWSPDGSKIAFSHQPNPGINGYFKSDVSILDIESKKFRPLVNNPAIDVFICWSPDSKTILYESTVDNNTSNFYTNSRYFRININGKNNKELAGNFDENLGGIEWTDNGIYATAYQKTRRKLFVLNPKNGAVKVLVDTPYRINGFSLSENNNKIAFNGSNPESLSEIYIMSMADMKPRVISNFSKQIKNWLYSRSEVISWKSKDGAVIEGILHKPMDYDPSKKYPLLVNIHGGPTGISTPSPTPSYVYPVLQWLNKGALVLMPNYRGSAGYGEEFRTLNVENLGVGDMWDVMSGIEYLDSKGMIETDKMGSMGWSQGGYISAFLTTNTNVFKAISVGAGISNWMTYYVNTDIHPFTKQYLKATPWSNEEIYRKTSPMTNINKASTPTLIQHGEFDQRVPIPNAYELYQGLQDLGVETKLIVYKGFGHGITKPKERLAAMWHNWQWFGKYIWGEDIALPKK